MENTLFSKARSYEDSLELSSLYITLFNRPYYLGIPISDYGKVLIVASRIRIVV